MRTPIVHLGRSFINYAYEVFVKIENDSDLPAAYELVDQPDDEEKRKIIYTSPAAKVRFFCVVEFVLRCWRLEISFAVIK